jgi:hypothetical protein
MQISLLFVMLIVIFSPKTEPFECILTCSVLERYSLPN